MYIDPNTGGMLFQILAVVFTVISGTVLVFSSRIRMLWARLMRKKAEKSEMHAQDETTQQPPQD
jgi:hypothetical protein